MGVMLILSPAPVAAIAASRGTGVDNLLTLSPREAWVDAAVGSAATIDLDLGAVRSIDTVFLGHVDPAAAGASWTITGGASGYAETVIKAAGALRVPDSPGQAPTLSHALWHGAAASVRYLRISVTQPGGSPALGAGVVMAGLGFKPALGREWGSGRRPIDMSNVTELPDGGIAVVEGARKRALSWTFGDLSEAETDALESIAMDRGNSRQLLVVEDPAPTAGLLRRIFYCRFDAFRAFERRNRAQTRWELSVTELV